MTRLALTISYDGTDFSGSQSQPGRRTVQAEIERALATLFGGSERTEFAGRTDHGVHAIGQVVGCADRKPTLAVETIREALNANLPHDVVVLRVARREETFHARFDARWREYRYRVWVGPRQPLAGRVVWERSAPLDLGRMNAAAERLLGRHDVASLAGGGDGVPWSPRQKRERGTIRTVFVCACAERAPWWITPDPSLGCLIEMRMVADGFLPRMVRNTAAILVEVGRGRRPVAWIDELLAARDRRAGVGTAPAHGLTLWRVGYGDEMPDETNPAAGHLVESGG